MNIPKGYQLAPIEPTEEMIYAIATGAHRGDTGKEIWSEALAYAAEQPAPVVRCSFCDATDQAGNPWTGHHESVDGDLVYRVMGCKDHKYLVDALIGVEPAPVAAVMPEHRDSDLRSPVYGYARGWNDCLDEFARLN